MPKSRRKSWRIRFGALCAGTSAIVAAAVVAPSVMSTASAAPGIPRYDHVVVVVHENANHEEIIGNSQAPFINKLADGGASFTNFHGVTHPSQPNYLAMFSGSTQGVTGDSCPPGSYTGDNLGRQLLDVGATWGSYNEDWTPGDPGVCTSGYYARKHNPWFSFTNVPASTAFTTAQFPTNFDTLPNVSYVVPNQCNDMHNRVLESSCSITNGDTWTQNKLGAYAEWAKTHNSLLIVTFDEDAMRAENRIATVFYGAHVKPGRYNTRYDHYNVLRTLEDMYDTRRSGQAVNASPITEVWKSTDPNQPDVTSPGDKYDTVGKAVTPVQIPVDGGTAPYTCAFQGLPAGLSASGCTVQGTPTTAGTGSVTVTATDTAGRNSAPVSFTWTVSPPGVTVTLADQTSKLFRHAEVKLAITGGKGPYLCSQTGLPAGLGINPFDCTIWGSSWWVGTFPVTVTAMDSTGAKGTASIDWTVTWL